MNQPLGGEFKGSTAYIVSKRPVRERDFDQNKTDYLIIKAIHIDYRRQGKKEEHSEENKYLLHSRYFQDDCCSHFSLELFRVFSNHIHPRLMIQSDKRPSISLWIYHVPGSTCP